MSEIIDCDTCDYEHCIMLWSKEPWVMKIWEDLRHGIRQTNCEYKNPQKVAKPDEEMQLELF